jgi:hypothetical protein
VPEALGSAGVAAPTPDDAFTPGSGAAAVTSPLELEGGSASLGSLSGDVAVAPDELLVEAVLVGSTLPGETGAGAAAIPESEVAADVVSSAGAAAGAGAAADSAAAVPTLAEGSESAGST